MHIIQHARSLQRAYNHTSIGSGRVLGVGRTGAGRVLGAGSTGARRDSSARARGCLGTPPLPPGSTIPAVSTTRRNLVQLQYPVRTRAPLGVQEYRGTGERVWRA
eukprot:1676399-Rhodomonas_salina.4